MSTRTGLLGKQGEWLLLLTVAGQTFRFATAPVEVLDGGDLLQFSEGLEDLTHGLSGDGSTVSSIPLELVAGESWDKIVANFASIERSKGELRRWFDGQELPQTRLVLSGLVQSFAYGERDQAISLTLTRDIRSQSRELPNAGMVVNFTTWPVRTGGTWEPDTNIIGALYPIVLGAPGLLSGPVAFAYPGLLVEAGDTPSSLARVLVAGHRAVATEVELTDLTDPTNPSTDTRPVLEAADLLGRTISYVNVGASLPTAGPGRIYYVAHSLATGGGLPDPRTGTLLRGAGDIIEWLVTTWTDVQFDVARFSAVKARLNQYKLDTFVNEPTNALDLLDKWTAFLPVESRTGEEGLYFYARPIEATSIEAVADLNADLGEVDRDTLIQRVSDQIINEVTVEYQPGALTGLYRARVTVSGDTGATEDELDLPRRRAGLVLGNYRAQLSQELYGRQPATVSLDDVWDTTTATLVAQDIIAEQALPRRFVSYRAPPELEALEPGSLVTITDSTVGLTRELALLFDVDAGGPTVLLHLELLDDPATLRRFVSS